MSAPRGLPHALPPGETLIWQGAPRFRQLAVGAFHVRFWAGYVAVMLVWGIASALVAHHSITTAEAAGFWSLLLGVVALGIVLLMAFLTARTTTYTITNKRVVIGYGAAIRKHLNLPYRAIQSANLRLGTDDTGDIAICPEAGTRLSYLLLWPHVRSTGRGGVEPVLRAVPEAASVARLLVAALDPAHAVSTHAVSTIVAVGAARDTARGTAGELAGSLASSGHAA